MLACKVLERLGIETTPICFESYFFNCAKARAAARALGVDLRVEDFSKEHLEIVRKPAHGRGAGVNPCIDCHLLMLKTAKKIMERERFDFIATGEVLGQRSMSQNKLSLEIIERESGLTGKLLRPLSAKLLPETEIEKSGLVDRSRLGDISGRSRQKQLAMAAEFGVKDIPQPAGGCILTEVEYGRHLRELAAIAPDFDANDARILRQGRIFWEGGLLIAVARDQNECAALKNLAKTGDLVFEPQNFPGPAVLLRNFGQASQVSQGETLRHLGERYVLRFSKKIPLHPEISAKNKLLTFTNKKHNL